MASADAITSLIDFDKMGGLVPAIAQDADTGDVLMLAWMNAESLRQTVQTGRAVYYSRSRSALWRKGDESGHVQHVREIRVDCDADSILLRVDQTGPACHEGYRSCFFRRLGPGGMNVVAQRTQHQQKEDEPMGADARIAELNLELPPAPKPMGVYKPIVVVGDMAYVSGHGPLLPDGTLMEGRVGTDVDKEFGIQAARQTGLAILATLRSALGSLDRIERVVKVLGMVNSAPDFREHPQVINGFSELFRDVFGEDRGVAARSAIGMGSLPGNIPVEIEAIFHLSAG